jgi:ABC-type transport system involved in cytochrome c biogenesis permease subunit
MLQSEQNIMYFHVSAAIMMMMIFKIKFEPTEKFSFEE